VSHDDLRGKGRCWTDLQVKEKWFEKIKWKVEKKTFYFFASNICIYLFTITGALDHKWHEKGVVIGCAKSATKKKKKKKKTRRQ
jgi:hypothetical protein